MEVYQDENGHLVTVHPTQDGRVELRPYQASEWRLPHLDPQPEAARDLSAFRRSTGFHEGQREWTDRSGTDRSEEDLDPMRWGDVFEVDFGTVTALTPIALESKQLVRAHTRRPVVWVLFATSQNNEVNPAEVNPINLDFQIRMGCGQAVTRVLRRLTLTAANGYQLPVGAFGDIGFFIPAQDLQISCVINFTPTTGGPYRINLAAVVAPFRGI